MKKTVAFILVIVMLSAMLFSCAKDPVYIVQGGGVGLVVDPNAEGEREKQTQEAAPGIAIPGWGELTIPPNTTENISVDFHNPDANAGKYYLEYELRLPKADNPNDYEVLYKSNLIPPGQHIYSITLNRGLEVGEYDAVVHVQPYKMADKSPTNNADLKLKIKAVAAN